MKTPTNSEKLTILAKVKKLVLKHHINVGDVDYDAWAKALEAKAPALSSASAPGFESGVRSALAELKTSHTTFFHTSPDQLLPQHTLNATLRKVRVAETERWMFLDVFESGAADQAGIKPGQLLSAVDGIPVALEDVPKFAIGTSYTFTVTGPQDGSARDVTVHVPQIKGSKAQPPLVPPKTISHRMLEPGLGYLRIGWFTASMGLGFSKELDAAIQNLKANGTDRLVIDLRGNIGGGLGFARLASYLCPGNVAIGQSLTPNRLRSGFCRDDLPRVPMPSTAMGLVGALTRFLVKDKSLVLLTQGLGPQPFHGRIAVLVNEWTSSAAEMVANFAAENKLATVVGTTTSGTVLGARNFAVGSGYWLRIPIFGWFTSKGGTIEGIGVDPDIAVDTGAELAQHGRDRQMEAAVNAVNALQPDRPAGKMPAGV